MGSTRLDRPQRMFDNFGGPLLLAVYCETLSSGRLAGLARAASAGTYHVGIRSWVSRVGRKVNAVLGEDRWMGRKAFFLVPLMFRWYQKLLWEELGRVFCRGRMDVCWEVVWSRICVCCD